MKFKAKTITEEELNIVTMNNLLTLYKVDKEELNLIFRKYPEISDYLYLTFDILPLVLEDKELNIIIQVNSISFLRQDIDRFNMIRESVKDGKINNEYLLLLTEKRYKEDVFFSLIKEEKDLFKVRELAILVYCELGYINRYDEFKDIFEKTKGFITENDIEIDEDVVTIYRGVTEKSSEISTALSWTLSKEVAKFFSTRFDSDGEIYCAKINKEDILVANNLRNEFEVIVNPEKLMNVSKIFQEKTIKS